VAQRRPRSFARLHTGGSPNQPMPGWASHRRGSSPARAGFAAIARRTARPARKVCRSPSLPWLSQPVRSSRRTRTGPCYKPRGYSLDLGGVQRVQLVLGVAPLFVRALRCLDAGVWRPRDLVGLALHIADHTANRVRSRWTSRRNTAPPLAWASATYFARSLALVQLGAGIVRPATKCSRPRLISRRYVG